MIRQEKDKTTKKDKMGKIVTYIVIYSDMSASRFRSFLRIYAHYFSIINDIRMGLTIEED